VLDEQDVVVLQRSLQEEDRVPLLEQTVRQEVLGRHVSTERHRQS
jgi:hypothetical protein